MNVQFLSTVNGMPMETGLNAQRAVEVVLKSGPEKSKLKPGMEEDDVMEPTRIFNFAMNSLVQLTVYGMTTAPGLNVIRIVVEEPNTELVLYIKKQNTEASHVKEMQRKKLPAMKIHVQ